jgi:UDP-glucose 4-epimerase
MIEEILRDLHRSDPSWRFGILRYFNPAGAHASGMIGEDPRGIPNNLLPIVSQVAVGRRACLNVWGNDYPTSDGTGVRDYIHVMDLALGHLKALKMLEQTRERVDCLTVNLGTGTGYSVLDIVREFEQASGRSVPYKIAPRRSGDIASCYADPKRAYDLLGWRAERGLSAMCTDAWRWQHTNPDGYTG